MGYYKPEDVVMLRKTRLDLDTKTNRLMEEMIRRRYLSEGATEHARYGFSRRVRLLRRIVQAVFEIIPPDYAGLPDTDSVLDTTAYLHAFYVNAFGACDNLAWILVHELGIRKTDGAELPAAWIGLRKDNFRVRECLSKQLISKLDALEDWFRHVDDFRHSLAHRIPLYVPPYIVLTSKLDEYTRLEKEAWQAMRNGDIETNEELEAQKMALVAFRPWFTHSYLEKSPSMVIHPQLLADFGAINDLAAAVLEELERV